MSAHVPPPPWVDPLARADAQRKREAEIAGLARDLGSAAARARRLGFERVGAAAASLAVEVEET